MFNRSITQIDDSIPQGKQTNYVLWTTIKNFIKIHYVQYLNVFYFCFTGGNTAEWSVQYIWSSYWLLWCLQGNRINSLKAMEHCIYIVSEYVIQFSLLNGILQSLLNVSLGLQHCFTIVSLEEIRTTFIGRFDLCLFLIELIVISSKQFHSF